MLKVSVIVPVYNAEPYLHECLDSLMNQTLSEIEVIAVNDGSNDGSQAILDEYANAWEGKLLLLKKENGGQASARNMAISHASGEYVGFVDSDDLADTQMFEKLYRAASEANADLAVCDHYCIENGEKTVVRFADYKRVRDMLISVLVSPWNKLIRRDVLERSGAIFPEGYIYEDTSWFAKLIPFIGSMTNVHEPLLYHFIRENSTMTKAQGLRTAQIFPVMDDVVEFYKSHGLYDEYHDELEYFYTRILLLSSMRRIAQIGDTELRHRLEARTIAELNGHFPAYKRNPYLCGWRGMYIKCASKSTLRLAVCMARAARAMKIVK